MALLTNQTVLPQTNGFIVPIILPPGTVPGGNTGTGTPNTGKKPTLDAILAFLGGLADSLFPNGIGGSGTTPPIYIPPQKSGTAGGTSQFTYYRFNCGDIVSTLETIITFFRYYLT